MSVGSSSVVIGAVEQDMQKGARGGLEQGWFNIANKKVGVAVAHSHHIFDLQKVK